MTSPTTTSAAAGPVFGGRYRLVECVYPNGRPGPVPVGTLWRAHDEALDRFVAIRLLQPGGSAARAAMTGAAIANRLAHPGISAVFDAADLGTHAYVVSDWVLGESLAATLASGPLSDDTAVAAVRALSAAIAAAHAAGVVHGRLTPDHVMVTPEGSLRVVGFGLPGPARPGDDIRALGALLYAMVTGWWPLSSPTSVRTLAAPEPGSAPGVPAPPPGCPPLPADIAALLSRILSPQSHGAGAIRTAAALRGVLGARPWMTQGTPEPRGFWTRRVTAGALLLIAAVGGLGIGVALGTIPGIGHRDSPPDAPTTGPSASASAVPQTGRYLTPEAARSFDPEGSGAENEEEVPYAWDDNPGTIWRTDQYAERPDFGGVKSGTGLLFDLGSSRAVRSATIISPQPGMAVELRASDRPSGDVSSYALVAQTTHSSSREALAPAVPARARYWLVWITRLPPDGQGYRGVVAEVAFRS